MKIFVRFLLLALLSFSFAACHFKEPVFTEGFAKVDPALNGVWATDGTDGDPRKIEFAVCAPLDDALYLIHHPATDKGSIYYDARPIVVRGRTLLQLRVLATLNNGLPKADDARFTLVWIEKDADGKKIRVRSLEGDALKDKGPADVRKELETLASDWGKLFGQATAFHRLDEH